MDVPPARFECSFALVAAILAASNGIADKHRSAFASRLKNFQRLGYPQGINTGRGRAATYGAHHLFKLGLAVQLSQLGLPPDRVVKELVKNERVVLQAAVDEMYSLAHQMKGVAFDREGQNFIGFDPHALQDMAESVGSGPSLFTYGDWTKVRSWLVGQDVWDPSRLAIIPLSRFVNDLVLHVSRHGGDFAVFLSSLAEWAASEMAHHD